MAELMRDPLLVADPEVQEETSSPYVFPSPLEPAGTPERESLVEFYKGAYETDEEREREMEAIVGAKYFVSSSVPVDSQRLNLGQYTPEDRKFFKENLIAFPETTVTAGDRYAYMARLDGSHVISGDKSKGPAGLNFFPLGITKERKEMLETEDLSPLETGFQYARSFLTGGGPYALKDLDERLKKLDNPLNQTYRTFLLRGTAEGRFTADKLALAFEEGLQFFGEAPTSYLPQATSYLTADLLAPGAEWLLEEDYTSGRLKTREFFEKYSMDWSTASERLAEKHSTPGYKLRTDVVGETTRAQGLTERTGVFILSDAAFAGAQSLYHGGRALVSDLRFKNYMKKTFNTDTVQDAFTEAAERGLTFENITRNYLEGVSNDRARRKLAERLDTSFAFRVMLPGNQRQKVFSGRMDEIKKDLKGTEYELDLATKAGDLKGQKNAKLRIEKLQNEAKAIETKVLLPKYFRDLFGEVTEQAVVASYMAETAYKLDIMGTAEESALLAEFFGAISVAIPGVRDYTTAPKRAVSGAMRWAANLAPGVNIKDAYRSADPQTKKILKNIFKDSTGGMAQAFVAGSNEGVRIRRDLMKLADDTGVDVDYDYFSNTLVDLLAIEELKAVSDSLNGQIVIQNLDGLNKNFSRKIETNNKMKEMVSKLAEATYKLVDMRADGTINKTNHESLERFVAGMNVYIADLQKTIDDDKLFINDLLDVQSNTENLLIKGGLRRSTVNASGGEESLGVLDDVYENKENAIISRYEGDMDAGVVDPEAGLENLRTEINTLLDERATILEKSANELTSAQSALGGASQHYAATMVGTKRKYIVNSRRMYRALDRNHQGARANVTEFYKKFSSIADFVDGDIEDYSAGAIRLRGMDPQSLTKTGAKILFNDGAKRGLSDLREQIGDDVYTSLLEHAELDGMQPIQQWEGLKKFLQEPGEKAEQVAEYVYIPGVSDPEKVGELAGASDLADGLLMLISPSEWRAVNSHMGNVLFKKKREGVSVTYSNLKDEWNQISDPNSPMAFMKGYDTGVPENVTEDFYREFKDVNSYYEANVSDRLYTDDDTSRWFGLMSRKVMSKRDGDMPRISRKAKKGDQPINWLDQLLKPAQDIKDNIPMDGEILYQNLGMRLAKTAGAEFDPELGKYVFIAGDKSTDAIKAVLTAHMRGRLIRTKAGKNIIDKWDPTTARKPGEKDPFMLEEPLDFNDAEFKSMLNLPVYTRDDAGNLVESGKLLNDEEIYSAIDLDALERNRQDLRGMFEEVEVTIDRNKADALSELSAVGITTKNEIGFAEDLAKTFGINVGKGGLSVANMNKISENIYTVITSRTAEGFAGDIARIKNGLRQRALEGGVTPNNVDLVVDDFLRRMTIQHIYGNSVVAAGNYFSKDGMTGSAMKMAMGLDGDSIRVMLGKTDLSGQTEKNLQAILGADIYANLETVADSVVRLQAKAAKGVGAKKPGMSLESILSRIYNINRQVVSTQWVATETIIRASRNSGAALFHAMLSDEKVARQIFDIIETGQIPEYGRQLEWTKESGKFGLNKLKGFLFESAVLREIARFESLNNELVPSISTMAPTPSPLPTGEQEPTPPRLVPLQKQMISLGYEPQ